MMGGVFIEVVIFWYDMLVTIRCAVPFQNFVVIPDMLEISQLRFQFAERCLIVFFHRDLAVCPITQQEDILPSRVRIMLRDGMTQDGFM